MWQTLCFYLIAFQVYTQGNRQALKFINQKFEGKLDTNPYFYYHTKRSLNNNSNVCFSDSPYCMIINNRSLTDNVFLKSNDPEINRLKIVLEQTTLSLVEMIDQRKKDKQYYYYADLARTQYDQMVYHKPTQSPKVNPF